MALQAPACAREFDATMRSTPVAGSDLVLQLRGPDCEDVLRRAQAARAAAMTALVRRMVAETAAWLDRLRDRVSNAIGARAFSSQP